MTKIKICGFSRDRDIEIVNELLPDYIGFVFAESKRQISDETAAKLKARLHSAIQVAGVFVNEDRKRIIKLCEQNVIDIVQLHGDEDEEYIIELKKSIFNPIIKAVRVKGRESPLEADTMKCDYILLDTYKQAQYGGSGERFDWSMIPSLTKPIFLAGGIQVGNVLEAIKQVSPYCIDVSSAVETQGVKDGGKIKEIIAMVRSV
ncbi:MAG: N-(5-phosphoribosyl)anthranilate isomerase [Herbinix sp.]|nr:N-(5-phosphoribosyl)anthranilate isomerase [Herbinix sp.]